MTEKSKYSGLKKVIGATALALGIGVWSSSYTIDQTEQAVVTRFGNPVRVILNPIKSGEEDNSVEELSQEYSEAGIRVNEGAGLYFKLPLVDSIRRFDRRLLRWNGYAEQIPTKDKKYIMVNTTARFRIYDPLKFLNTVGTEDQAHGRLDDIVDSTARNIITTKNLISVVRSDNRPMRVSEEELKENTPSENVQEGGRQKIVDQITAESRRVCLERYGVDIHEQGVLIKSINYVPSVKEAVEKRMTEERLRIAEKYKSEGEGEYQKIMGEKEREQMKIKSEAYKTAKEVSGKADAEATKVYAEAFNKDPEFFRFWRTLELYEQDGFANGTRLVIGIDNPLMELMSGKTIQVKEEAKK